MAHVTLAPRAFILVIIVLTIAFGLGLAFIYLPHATITIAPRDFTKQAQKEIVLSATLKDPDFIRFALPAKIIEKEADASQTITRQGTITPDFARGRVTIFNKQGEEQPLLPKTHLKHEATGAYFLTDQAVRVPVNSQVDVNVTAEEKGPAGNVPAGKFIIDRLPTELQTQIYGESQTVFAGGETTDSPVTDKELADAKAQALQKATDDVRIQIGKAAGTSIKPELISIETIANNANAEPGSRATSFVASAHVKGRAFVVNENDVLSLTLLALRAQASPDEEFDKYQPDSFKLELLRADFDRGEARVKGTLTGMFSKSLPNSLLDPTNLAGRSAAEAQDYFKQFENAGEVTVDLSPFWVKAVPARAKAVTIMIKAPNTK